MYSIEQDNIDCYYQIYFIINYFILLLLKFALYLSMIILIILKQHFFHSNTCTSKKTNEYHLLYIFFLIPTVSPYHFTIEECIFYSMPVKDVFDVHFADNAYDPDVSASELYIDKKSIHAKDCLVFTDNGNGMNSEKLHKMLR